MGRSTNLRGQAEIHYRNYVLYADEVTYNSATGDTEVEGHVVLDGGPYDEHVEASHGNYNVRTQVGTFYDVIGTAGFRLRRSGYILTTSNPFAFTGKVVEKQGPDHYLVRQGTVTTCELPRPKWAVRSQPDYGRRRRQRENLQQHIQAGERAGLLFSLRHAPGAESCNGSQAC